MSGVLMAVSDLIASGQTMQIGHGGSQERAKYPLTTLLRVELSELDSRESLTIHRPKKLFNIGVRSPVMSSEWGLRGAREQGCVG